MKLKRYFVEAELREGKIVTLDGEEYHHMKNVMRTQVGDHVVLFNGTTFEAEGKVISMTKTSGEIEIITLTKNENEPTVKVTLYQGVSKGDKLSLITQKITELGASDMVVFYSDYTDIKDKTNKLDKLFRVSVSAAKQCGRSSLVNVSGVVSFNEILKFIKSHEKVFVAYENQEGNTLSSELIKNNKYKDVAIVIGAEGGFSEREIEKLKCEGASIVSLGKRILRTETAAIVSVAEIIFAVEK